MNHDFQKAVDQERSSSEQALLKAAGSQNPEDYFKAYQRYPAIVAFVRQLKTDFPNQVELFNLANKTAEGREIIGLRVFGGNGGFQPTKPGLFMNAMQHAREWISTPTLLYLVWSLLNKYKRGDPTVVPLLNAVNLHIVPMVNPDGFEYSYTSRMWRKNRFRNRDGSFGVDLNRNFVVAWGGPGSSRTPSSDIYCGTHALSEAESIGIDNYLKSYPSMKVGIDYHSYSQYILRNWDYTNTPSQEEQTLTALSNKWRAAMRASPGGLDYVTMRGSQMYIHSGGLMDQFLGQRKMLGFTVELRPRSGSFVIDPSNIIPSGRENEAGVIEVMKHIATDSK
jgi:murein tripeptide amidase MpaA